MIDMKDKLNKKLLFMLIGVIITLIIVLGLIFLIPRFHVKQLDASVILSVNSKYKDTSSVCYGNFIRCKKIKPIIKGKINENKLGEYDLTYKFKYNRNTLTKNIKVKVIDNIKPQITVEESEYYYCPNKKVYNYKVVATDNYDGDITNKVNVSASNNKITYWVNDSSNNIEKVTLSATEKDNDKPEIKLNGDNVKYILLNKEYIDEGATAIDFCDGDLTDKIIVDGVVDTSKKGEYTLTYRVSDSSSNEAIIKRKIYVYDKNNYVTPGGKSIYLTFDDGPSRYTNYLLDVLAKYNVKATFFVTDQGLTKGYDNVIKRAYDEGHTIALHSASHNYAYIYTNLDNYFNDLYAIQNKVKNITGYAPTIVRLPGGSSNTVSKNYDGGQRIMTQITNALTAREFRYFDWNVASGDTDGITTASGVASNVINALGNNSTYVVLQHDIKGYSVDAVEEIIKYALANGYTFRPLTMESPNVHHGLNN